MKNKRLNDIICTIGGGLMLLLSVTMIYAAWVSTELSFRILLTNIALIVLCHFFDQYTKN